MAQAINQRVERVLQARRLIRDYEAAVLALGQSVDYLEMTLVLAHLVSLDVLIEAISETTGLYDLEQVQRPKR